MLVYYDELTVPPSHGSNNRRDGNYIWHDRSYGIWSYCELRQQNINCTKGRSYWAGWQG